ncbi:MAG: hypothetical protein Q8M29_04295 [Bacteroidota bacterium]|nr:hypothetical protein [Bacteroidota bacterium]
MNESLLERYSNYHPDIIITLDHFDSSNKSKILKKLKKEKDKNNFLSTVSEIKFGKLFMNSNFKIEYDRVFQTNQTPDWTISIDNAFAICDVYCLGKSKIDQLRSDFENQLIEKIKKIKGNYCIRISFIKEYFDSAKYNTDEILTHFNEWLISSRKTKGESILIENNFKFEIFHDNTKYDYLAWVGNISSIDFKPSKLKQPTELKPNEITKKLFKYNNLIEKLKTPYLICVDIDFTSGYEPADFEEYFRGHQIEFVDYGDKLVSDEKFNHPGNFWTELGVFYDTPQLSGIITLYNGEYKLLMNPKQTQVIYENRYISLLNILSSINTKTDKS